jgi:hypothetical protein
MQLFQLYYLSMLDLYESIQKNKLDVIPQATILSYHPKNKLELFGEYYLY